MKAKQDKTFYISRAKRDMRDLFIYFNITRPQYVPYYKVDGSFNKDKLLKELDFLTKWKHMRVEDKKYHAKTYTQYERNFNMTFSIPRELMAKVAGEYKDDDGKKHRVNYEQIVEDLVKEGFIKVLNAGRKFERIDGQYKVKCWWCKKYIMANEKQWFKLMAEDKYKDIYAYASKRVQKIIAKWNEQFIVKQPIDKEDMGKMFMSKGIGVEDVVVLSLKVFKTERERVGLWLKKYEEQKDNIKWHEQATRKEMREFWARVYFGNMRDGEYDEATKKWAYNKYKENIF